MATFSPSPAPRRTTRARPQATTPPRRARISGNSKHASRFASPVDAGQVPHDARSVLSGMDVDDASSIFTEQSNTRSTLETIFGKSDQLTVLLYASLPLELRHILKNADFYEDGYTGTIDTLTGFALVASPQTCFVWQHAQAVKSVPTCYIFSCPQGKEGQKGAPYHALVPFGSSREPGLILLSSTGVIRFWDNIGIGLAGGEHFTTAHLSLTQDEGVTNLVRCDPQNYIASTTLGNLFRLVVTSVGGKCHLDSHIFSRPTQSLSLSRFLPSLFSPASNLDLTASHFRYVNAIALGARNSTGDTDIWALVDMRLQKWNVKAEGWEEFILNEDIATVVASLIRSSLPDMADKDDSQMDLELLDLAIDSHGKLIVLTSIAASEEGTMAIDANAIRRVYTLVYLSCLGNVFNPEGLRSIPYQTTVASGAPMHPRIQLLADGAVICVQFGDAVALCARDSDFRDRLELRSAIDRTLGIGVISAENAILVMTASTTMKVLVDLDQVLAYDHETGQAKLVKSIMTQAILYGSLPDNPLHFSFPPEINEESLMQGAEQLSQAVLQSDPLVVRRNHDLTAQLTARKERLSWLIHFINNNMVLGKMSQRSRQRLATDAEKLYACYQLWLRHNDLLATNPRHSILNDIVANYMHEAAEDNDEDVIRAFLRLKAGDISQVVKKVLDATRRASETVGSNIAEFLPEANRIALTVLQSAFDYREYNLGVYGIELPMIKPWSSKPAIIEVVMGLFDATTSVVESSMDRLMDTNQEPSSQLPHLAAVLFACIQERLDWLNSPVSAEEVGSETDAVELDKKFALLRPEVLETLRRIGHEGAAFTLAEKYRDFSSLAALCHRGVTYPPEENTNLSRIQAYIERFKDEFATELYKWYIQHGELRTMFAQEDEYGTLMDKFFAVNPTPAISWIHHLGKKRYGAAASSLLAEAQRANQLNVRELMLSIGKLSYLAQLQETIAVPDNSVLDAFHDGLDFVSVHEALLEGFKTTLGPTRGRQSLDSQIDVIMKSSASNLSDRKALPRVFRNSVRDLMLGKALSVEDVVDILTLKDNAETLDSFSTALHLLAHSQNLPTARKTSSFRTVWRRIYIHDDWDAIRKTFNVSDAELKERFRRTALYHTLCIVLPQEDKVEGIVIMPDVALQIPSWSEISSRWPGLPPDHIEEIVQDYNYECDKLGEMDLEDIGHRVRELAEQDMVLESISP